MNDALVLEIVSRFHAGASVRRIAQSLQISRRTVRRALKQVEPARADGMPQSLSRPILCRGSQLDAYNTAIADLLARYPDMTAQRIHVERRFAYVESSLLGGRSFRSLEHLNETTVWWLAEVADVHVHRQTKARPVDRHVEEQPHLLPLPRRLFDASEVVYRTVDAEGFVVYRQNFYSAPWRLIGQTIAVRATENELMIYDRSSPRRFILCFLEIPRHNAAISRNMSHPAMPNVDR